MQLHTVNSHSLRKLAIQCAHYEADVAFRRPEIGDTRADHMGAANAHIGHPYDLPFSECGQKSRNVETISREAHQWEWRRVDDLPAGRAERFPQNMAHARLVLDSFDEPRFSLLRERHEELETDEPA